MALIFRRIELAINSPTEGATVQGPNLRVSGTAFTIFYNTNDDVEEPGAVDSVTVEVDNMEQVISDVDGGWSANFNITSAGSKTITATARYRSNSASRTRRVTVVLDSTAPVVTINQPSQGQIIEGPGPNYSVLIAGTATDQSSIDRVEYRIDGGNYAGLGSSSNWSKTIRNLSVGDHSLEVRATDEYGNTSLPSLRSFTFVDIGKPTIEITSPETNPHKITFKEEGVSVDVAGIASDPTSPIQSVQWRLDGGELNDATNVSGDWSNWRFTVDILTPGLHNLEVIATDGADNPNTDTLPIDVAVPFELEDVNFAAYLKDLMIFTERRVRQISNADPIDDSLLTANFYQPFDRLIDPDFQSVTTKPVVQVRIAIEVLRSFLTNYDQFSDYCKTAYRSLLTNFGTSYAELRLARGADSQTRQSLANRLGITEAELDRLFLTPEQMTEEKLQLVFGLRNTTEEPLALVMDQAEILTMRLNKLQANWLEQDRLNYDNAETNYEIPTPTIDPDLIENADLKSPISGNLAYDLLEQRRQWVEDQRESIQADFYR